MKTSRKISIIYSFITVGFILIAGVVFYFFSSGYTQSLYFKYLDEKAHAVAEEKFAIDEVDSETYHDMVLRRKNSIPTSKQLFINVADRKEAARQLSAYLSPADIKNLFNNKTVNFEKGQEVGTSFIYYDNSGTFAVVVLSRNPYGKEIGHTLGWAILILVLASAFILFLISRLYAMRMLDRIDHDYQTEKMFVNNASHEINNPLTAIQGECEVALMRNRSNEEYKSSLQSISQETGRIIRIMHELLLFSHTRSGTVDAANLENVVMSRFIFNLKDDATEINVVSDFSVLADEALLHIAVKNLLSNARKYSGGSPVVIVINHGLLQISDQGIGIPRTDISHIFEPFYRAGNTGSVKGKGVGLALAQSILKNFGAAIKVRSQEGKGTSMNVIFKKYKTC
jgi:two-component system sensor histidine kinase ArlS